MLPKENMKTNNCSTYMFRAECAADAHAIRGVLHPWLMEWNERRDNIEYEGVRHAMFDVAVEFSIVAEGPSLGELVWLVDGIDNAHVAADTLATVDSYTGERTFRRWFDAPAKRPDKEVLSRALEAVRTRQQVLILEQERALQLNRIIDSALRLGDKWKPSGTATPGWIVPITHKLSGLTAIRRITAPLSCRNLKKEGDGIVLNRVTTIHA
jgi:hypothetical protein